MRPGHWCLPFLLSAMSSQAAPVPPVLTPVEGRPAAIRPVPDARAFRIRSTILGQSREIYVGFPASYARSAPDRRYPVAIVLDGEANLATASAVAGQLAGFGQVPEMLLVAVANRVGRDFEESARLRVHDLTPPGLSVSGSDLEQGGDRFLDFIERELLPAVDREFRGGGPRVLIGHSSGGILATYAAATRPAFRVVLALDTPTHFGNGWLAEKLLARAAAARNDPAAPALRYASYEVRFGWNEEPWTRLAAAAPATWRLHREHLEHESHESLGLLAMYLGLREVFADYSAIAAPIAPTTSILPSYARVDSSLGAPVTPPRRLLRHVVEDLLMEGRGAAARDAYRMMAAGYGAPDDSASLLAEIAAVERRPPPTETVEGLLATPFPTPAEAAPYLGTWVGRQWMGNAPPEGEMTLRIRVENGRVVGETVVAHLPPEHRVRRWEYLRITSTGITWGNLNGMRPRALVLHEATREGDVLAGEVRFGGIRFVNPDGSTPPVIHFRFRRGATD